jgi:hypothetical protein
VVQDNQLMIPIDKAVLVLTWQQCIEALKAGKAYRRQGALKARITPKEPQGGQHREQTRGTVSIHHPPA